MSQGFPILAVWLETILPFQQPVYHQNVAFHLLEMFSPSKRSSMTEGKANAIMCCKYWLGYDEFSTQDMLQERVLVEESPEGDIDMTEEDET